MKLDLMLLGMFIWIVANLTMFFAYDLFKPLMDLLTSTSLGDLVMPQQIEAVSWGGFIGMYLLVAWVVPVFMVIHGLKEE